VKMLRIALGQVVIVVMSLLPFVDSLVYRTPSYSVSHADQFFEVHVGECHFRGTNGIYCPWNWFDLFLPTSVYWLNNQV